MEIIPKKFNEIKFLNKNTNEFSKKINPIFIIGLPRSGSTLVEGIISSGLIKIENGGETAIINAEIIKKVRDKKFDKNFAKIKFDLDLKQFE